MSYFEEQLNSDEVSRELKQLIDSICRWLDINGFLNKQVEERFHRVEDVLEEKDRNVLFLAEFSRGKSELINSTIFGSLGKRLLPSTPGRTTRCTTVLQYDVNELPSIRLLPTLGSKETLRQPISLLKQYPGLWERTLFAADDTDNIVSALKQISETELVSPKLARELGFLGLLDQDDLTNIDVIDGKIAIPKYRHAIINYPHPLLKQGLCITDTPGLNALGIEPELTLRSLESANAIVFVLSADTGITRSELQAWNEHVKHSHTDNVLVVINKIDTLWDELKTQEEIDLQIKKQVAEVARILGVPSTRVFPVSAQKSLVARRDNNYSLEKASRITKFELALADTINHTNRKAILARANSDISSTLKVTQRVLQQRKDTTRAQAREIQDLMQNQMQVSDNNIIKVRKERERLEKVAREINMFRVDLKMDYDHFVESLDIFALDKLIARYRLEISNQLTTTGLQREMNDFQAQAVGKFQHAISHIVLLEKKLGQLYGRVEEILEITGLSPRKIHPELYLQSLQKYNEKHTKYAKGISMVMTEQNALRDRYYASVMVKIRKLYIQTRDEVELWCRNSLVPLELELREKGAQLKKRLLSLERIRSRDSGLADEIRILESRMEGHRQRKNTIDHFIRRLEEISNYSKPNISNVIDLRSRKSAG